MTRVILQVFFVSVLMAPLVNDFISFFCLMLIYILIFLFALQKRQREQEELNKETIESEIQKTDIEYSNPSDYYWVCIDPDADFDEGDFIHDMEQINEVIKRQRGKEK